MLGDTPSALGDRITRRRGFAVQSFKPPVMSRGRLFDFDANSASPPA